MLGPALHITLVLVFYSLGVWAEKIVHDLKPWHVIAFWTGFLFDLLGTWMMHQMAGKSCCFSISHLYKPKIC